jgi:integrase
MTPDFAEFLAETREAERVAWVFPIDGPRDKDTVSRIIGKIARKARVVVGTTEKAKKVDGKLTTRTVKMYAGAHDLRRAFCTRWSRRVMPAVLQRLARHASIGTTMSFYVASTAEDIGAELWAAWGAKADNTPAADNTSDNNGPEAAEGAKDASRR